MSNKAPEIILRDDGFYEITILRKKADMDMFLKDSYGYKDCLASEVTRAFAERYVTENYLSLKSLIDMDVIKMLATRKLAGFVASD